MVNLDAIVGTEVLQRSRPTACAAEGVCIPNRNAVCNTYDPFQSVVPLPRSATYGFT